MRANASPPLGCSNITEETRAETRPSAETHYIPMQTPQEVVGVLAVRWKEGDGFLLQERQRLLDAFATQAALAIERRRLAEEAGQIRLLRATEQLQRAVLNSISHDLRTPLVSIKGTLKLSQKPCEMRDIIGASLQQMAGSLRNRRISVEISDALLNASIDFSLMIKVLVNLLDNAVKYSPPDSPIETRADEVEHRVEVQIADRGFGIPLQDLLLVFDKFYRVQRPQKIGGIGLGLSICKAIIEAHQGEIRIENRPGGGTLVKIALPVEARSLLNAG